MSEISRCRLYESGILNNSGQNVLRPGGLELTARALAYCSFQPGAKVADVGCGTGISVEYLRSVAGLDAVGVDSSELLLEQGRQKNASLPLINASSDQLPFLSETIAAVLAECSLSVMCNSDQVLREFNRVLVSAGKLILTDIYARSTDGIGVLRQQFPHTAIPGIMTQQELVGALNEQGFNIKIWEDHTKVWKEFIAQLIMQNGSLCEVWQGLAADNLNWQGFVKVTKQVCLGYYLLIAEKL